LVGVALLAVFLSWIAYKAAAWRERSAHMHRIREQGGIVDIRGRFAEGNSVIKLPFDTSLKEQKSVADQFPEARIYLMGPSGAKDTPTLLYDQGRKP